MAVAMAVKHHLWLRQALKELLIEDISAHLFCDNNSTIDYCHNSRVSDRTKHIDIVYHFVKERVEDGSVILLRVPTSENVANICTKGLPKTAHNYLYSFLFGTK